MKLWLRITVGALAIVATVVTVWMVMLARVFSDDWRREVARSMPEIQSFSLGEGRSVGVEKAFFVSSHGGLHGDGQQATAYKISLAEFPRLVAELKTIHPDYLWKASSVAFTDLAYLAHLLPEEFRPAKSTALEWGHPANGQWTQCYHVDRSLGMLFVVKLQF